MAALALARFDGGGVAAAAGASLPAAGVTAGSSAGCSASAARLPALLLLGGMASALFPMACLTALPAKPSMGRENRGPPRGQAQRTRSLNRGGRPRMPSGRPLLEGHRRGEEGALPSTVCVCKPAPAQQRGAPPNADQASAMHPLSGQPRATASRGVWYRAAAVKPFFLTGRPVGEGGSRGS